MFNWMIFSFTSIAISNHNRSHVACLRFCQIHKSDWNIDLKSTCFLSGQCPVKESQWSSLGLERFAVTAVCSSLSYHLLIHDVYTSVSIYFLYVSLGCF
jgi:hypothetical protein